MRFLRAEIAVHWSIAIPFMVCYVTGFVMKLFFNLHSESLVQVGLSWLHRASGVGLVMLPLMAVIRHRRDFGIHLYNIKKAWTWTLADVKWLLLMGVAAVSKRITLPEQHKFNAAEKINFMMVMGTSPLFALTGLVLLIPGVHFLTFVTHVGMALLVTPLILGHIYMALVNPSSRVGLPGMLSGHVDREWVRHHYPLWYEEHFGEDQAARSAEATTYQVAPIIALVRCGTCAAEHLVRAHAVVNGCSVEVLADRTPSCSGTIDLVSVMVEPGRTDPVLTALEQAGVRLVFPQNPIETRRREVPVEAALPAVENPRRARSA